MRGSPLNPLRCLSRPLGLILAGVLAAALPAQAAKPGKIERRDNLKRDGDAVAGEKPAPSAKNPDEAQERALAKLREQFDVADDAEWAIISERITRVNELRRTVSSSGSGFKGTPSIGDRSKRTSRSGTSAFSEQDALRSAVRDKLPDAEIKARLSRVHEVHRQNELKLAKAQAELRAVLTVRQEAVAVIVGLLPP
jgi:hypothetical protein